MDDKILEHLRCITEEESKILSGNKIIDRSLYMKGKENTINSKKLLETGKLITIRPHTRFIDFPEHKHDYVEVVYMCSGKTTHIVNGKNIYLNKGELLFLNQSAIHAVNKASISDIAINFIILPKFFNKSIDIFGEEETTLRRFLIDSLCKQNTGPGYLHFKVSSIPQIQNLIENLLWILIKETTNKIKVLQMSMNLLFLYLINYTDTLDCEDTNEATVLKVLRYIDTNYETANLKEISEILHYDVPWLSREIKNKTGETFTEIVQNRRLAQAAFLLKNTKINIVDISLAVGYENISYFHRIFKSKYNKSPKSYRDSL